LLDSGRGSRFPKEDRRTSTNTVGGDKRIGGADRSPI